MSVTFKSPLQAENFFPVLNRVQKLTAMRHASLFVKSVFSSMVYYSLYFLIPLHYFVWQLPPLFTENFKRGFKQCSSLFQLFYFRLHAFYYRVLQPKLAFNCFREKVRKCLHSGGRSVISKKPLFIPRRSFASKWADGKQLVTVDRIKNFSYRPQNLPIIL